MVTQEIYFTQNRNLESALTAQEKDEIKNLKEIVVKPDFRAITLEMSEAAYHLGPGVSKSGLDLIKRSPLHFAAKHIEGNIEGPTEAMIIGSITHMAILEPEKFKAKYVSDAAISEELKGKEIKRNTKIYKDALAEFTKNNFNKEIVKAEVFDQIMGMVKSIQEHPFAKELLSKGVSEKAIYWKDPETNILCKCKPDKLRDDGTIIDIKTTENASYDAFAYSIASYNYHTQASWYTDGVKMLLEIGDEINIPFVFIAVEKKHPYATACYILRNDSFNKGRDITRQSLRVLAECIKSNNWPGYQDSDIEVPLWALNK